MRTSAVKTWLLRLLWLLASVLALAAVGVWIFLRGSLATLDGKQGAAGLIANVTIARDDHGVPLISGSNRYDVAYATGFVHGQERYFQMDLLRRVAAGELAELFGPKAIPVDKSHRLHRLRVRAEESLKKMSADDRQFIERYVAGVNAGLDALTTRPFEYALVGAKPARWTAPDSLLVVWAMYFDLQGSQEARELARGWVAAHTDAAQRAFLLPEASEWDVLLDGAPVTAGAAPIPPIAPSWWGAPRSASGAKIVAADLPDFADSVGSNNWAIAGSRSADGRAIVADDMHLGLQLPHIWYRVALQFKDAAGKARRLVGVTLPGAPPIIVVGSNGHMAWGFTNSYGDFLDLIEVGVDAAKPGQVRTPAGWETPRVHEEVILVKGQPAERMRVRETAYGPLREVGGRTLAVHWIAQLPESVNINHRRLEDADTVADALDVAATLGVPAQNFVAGDDKGNIGWTIAGTLPRRAAPAIDASFPIAADNVALPWSGVLDPRDYPRIINPQGGQLSTANNRQLGGKGAEILGDGGFDLGARNHQINDDLTALGAKADVKSAYAISLDDRAVFLERWRQRAIAALDVKALEGHAQRAEFLRLLQTGWTGHASVDSAGYRLTRGFMWALQDLLYGAANVQVAALDEKATMHMASSRWPQIVARLLDEQPEGWLPAAYPSWQALQLAAVDRVIAELAADGKSLASATWGARNTAAIVHPIGKAVPLLKRWLSAPSDMLPGDANMPRVAGATFGQSERMTLSPGKEEEGIFNMPGGESGHPLSPYFLRGHEDWVKGTPTRLLPGPAQHTLTLVPVL